MRILITGASRGIGAGLYAAYRGMGHQVTGTARNGGADLWQLDQTDPGSIAALARHWDEAPLDLLICNAGIYTDRSLRLPDYSAALWAEAFACNVTGPALLIAALLPALRAARGRVALMSSVMASDALAPGGSYAYRASKAALLNLGRNLSRDLASDGIAVGIYHPGWVQTEMGGPEAAISVAQSVNGIMARLDALDLQGSGCFLNHDGTVIPF